MYANIVIQLGIGHCDTTPEKTKLVHELIYDSRFVFAACACIGDYWLLYIRVLHATVFAYDLYFPPA